MGRTITLRSEDVRGVRSYVEDLRELANKLEHLTDDGIMEIYWTDQNTIATSIDNEFEQSKRIFTPLERLRNYAVKRGENIFHQEIREAELSKYKDHETSSEE
jgi:hypothetical protein